MSSAVFQKPENAMKRANDLIIMGKKQDALNVLHATLINRKLRSHGWDVNTEAVMLKHIKLCVELEKFKLVREALHSYRYLTQQQNIVALSKALRELRETAEAKLKALKSKISKAEAAKLAEAAAAVVSDLDADESPESLLTSALQVDVRDKNAQELLNALLGCWESYKVIMDLVRYTPKIDFVYHETAEKAVEFCKENNRIQEFKRLCETLRTNYSNAQKQKNRSDFEGFLRPEMHLPAKLSQLSAAAHLNQWTQCFLTAEDIHALGLHDLLQRSLADKNCALHKYSSQLLQQTSMFYEKLAMIFTVSDQLLFHASAVLRNLFHIRQHKKFLSPAEQVRLSDIGTLAVLSVPIVEKRDVSAAELEHHRKLASMLGYAGIPTRASMKALIEHQNIAASASPATQRLYSLTEGNIDPLTLCNESLKAIQEVEKQSQLATYIPALKRVIFDKLLIKLSKIYTSLSIDFFSQSLCPESFLPWVEAEVMIVELVQQGSVQLRLDHSRKAILFGSVSSTPELILRNRLLEIAKTLSDLVPRMQLQKHEESAGVAMRDSFYADFNRKLALEATRLQRRNADVEARRRQQEEDNNAKEELRRSREQEKQKKEELDEQLRRDAAIRHQEELRRREEQQQQKSEIAGQIVAEFKLIAEKSIGGKIVIKGKAIEDITKEDIINNVYDYGDYESAQEELRSRERQDKLKQRRQETKRVEHLVRALREEEATMLQQWREETLRADQEFLAKVLEQEEQENRRKFEEEQRLRQTLIEIKQYIDKWIDQEMEKRIAVWDKQVEARFTKIKQVTRERKKERARERMKANEERIKREKEERKREEEERKREAERRQREQEELEKQEKNRRTEEVQRRKMAEIEQKQEETRKRLQADKEKEQSFIHRPPQPVLARSSENTNPRSTRPRVVLPPQMLPSLVNDNWRSNTTVPDKPVPGKPAPAAPVGGSRFPLSSGSIPSSSSSSAFPSRSNSNFPSGGGGGGGGANQQKYSPSPSLMQHQAKTPSERFNRDPEMRRAPDVIRRHGGQAGNATNKQ